MPIDIYLADWTFYIQVSAKERAEGVQPVKFIARDVITKRIPARFILNDGLTYKQAIRGISKTLYATLENDRSTGLKKFTIQFTKKIGEVNA